MTALIAWREFRSLFLSPLAWTVLAVVQFLLAFVFLAQLEQFQLVQPQLLGSEGAPGVTDIVAVPVLATATSLLLLIVPLLTMRVFAEERRSGTLMLLRSSPVSTAQIVLGKYLGLVAMLAVLIGMVVLMPISLALGTTLDWGKLAAATLGLMLMVSAFAAAGLYLSTLTRQPMIAAVAAFGLLLLLWMIDWAGSAAQRFTDIVSYLSLIRHYQPLLRGVFDSADVVYYLLFVVLFIGLAIRRLDAETALPGWRLRAQGWGFIVLFVAALGTAALLSTRYSFEADWTAARRNTLTDASRELARSIERPVKVTAYLRATGVAQRQVQDLVARYQREADVFTLEFVNPDLDPARAREAGVATDNVLVLEYDGRIEHLSSPDERAFSQALQRLTRGGDRLLVFTTGHGERNPLGQANHDLGVFGVELRRQGVQVQTLNPVTTGEIPAGTSALVVTQPRAQFVPGTAEPIVDYIARGGNVLWLADPEALHGLEPVARALGISVSEATVEDTAARMFGIDDPRLVVVASYGAHPVTQDFEIVTLFPHAATVAPVANAEGWTATPLLSTIAGETIGVALGRGEQRVVVIGDGDFLANQYLNNGGNLELGLNAVNWLVTDDSQLDIALRSARDLSLTLSRNAYIAIGAGFLFVLPLVLVGVGVGVWRRRRRR
ncbi:MAG: DUF4350 domain-containing protein [Gammaproteobacteria bacterium]